MSEENKIIEKMALDICKSRFVANVDNCRKCSQHEHCLYQDIACGLYKADYRKKSELTPCDVCRFDPPTSGDGKPCFMCPSQAKGE